jgi:hypothetical protein
MILYLIQDIDIRLHDKHIMNLCKSEYIFGHCYIVVVVVALFNVCRQPKSMNLDLNMANVGSLER